MYNKTSLTRFAATVAKLAGVQKPVCADEGLDWVCDVMTDICKEGFDRILIHNPDAMGMFLYEKYPDMFEPVLKHTQLTVPLRSPMPSWTPVCFATMYTGAEPAVHGIQKYEKPIIRIDTLFDALIRAGKKVAILATAEKSSMATIFRERDMDIITFESEGQLIDKAQDLIIEDSYDVLIVYTIRYDFLEHRQGPEGTQALAAAYRECTIFDQLVSTVKRNWTNHNTLIAFAPDHGVHRNPDGTVNSKGLPLLGDHGTDVPEDLNILHYFGAVRRKS